MENHLKNEGLLEIEDKKSKKDRKFRDTVLVRLERGLKEEALGHAKQKHETLSKVMGYAVAEYLDSVRSR